VVLKGAEDVLVDGVHCSRWYTAELSTETKMSLSVLNDDNFSTEVLESNVPVMVDFYATWCGPCKALSPIVEKLAGEFDGRIKVGKLNIDEAPQTPSQFAVRAVPTIVFFKDGKAVDTLVGLKRESELRQRIESLL
jgi:thioredoxin 1